MCRVYGKEGGPRYLRLCYRTGRRGARLAFTGSDREAPWAASCHHGDPEALRAQAMAREGYVPVPGSPGLWRKKEGQRGV